MNEMDFKKGDLVETIEDMNYGGLSTIIPEGTRGIIQSLPEHRHYNIEFLDFESNNSDFNKWNKDYRMRVFHEDVRLIASVGDKG